MAEDNHRMPLAPVTIYGRSDEEKMVAQDHPPSKCFAMFLTLIVSLFAVALIFSIIFLKPISPTIRFTSISVSKLNFSTTPSPSLNASLLAQVSIRNSNFGRFQYEQSTAALFYGGVRTGEGVVGSGRVSSRFNKKTSLVMEVRSERVFAEVWRDGNLTAALSGNLTRDLDSGMVEMRGGWIVAGRVYLLDVIGRKKTVQVDCSMSLDLRNSRVQNLICR